MSHLDGRGHRSALAELDLSQRALPAVANLDVLIEDGVRDDPAVLRDRLQSQDCVLRDRRAERETDYISAFVFDESLMKVDLKNVEKCPAPV